MGNLDLKKLQKEAWQGMTWKEKIESVFGRLKISFLVLIGKCPHEATFGRVGADTCLCLECGKEVANTDK